MIDYWLENRERKFPIIRNIDIPSKHLTDIDRRQLAALLTVYDYPSRIKFMFDDFIILEQYLNITAGVGVTIRDPNTNKECTGKIFRSELVNFKIFHFLRFGSKEIRFGIDSLIQVSYGKAPSAPDQEFLVKQQSQLYNKYQTSKINAAGTVQPEHSIHNNKSTKSNPHQPCIRFLTPTITNIRKMLPLINLNYPTHFLKLLHLVLDVMIKICISREMNQNITTTNKIRTLPLKEVMLSF